jgi:hypothetical protein
MTPPMTAIAIGPRNSEPSPVPTAVGIMPRTIAADVMRIGRRRSGPASRMACSGASPCSRTRTMARSMSRMAFFVTRPMRSTIPIIVPIAIVLLVRKSARIAPTSASGSVSMIVTGWMKLSNCDASTM